MPRILQFATRSIVIGALLTGAGVVFAHEGHGLHGSHWHATDLWGYVAVGVLIAAIIWQARK